MSHEGRPGAVPGFRLPSPTPSPCRPIITWADHRSRAAVGTVISHNVRVIEDLIGRMAALLESLRAAGDPRQYFHATYQRTTIAVAGELRRGGFAAFLFWRPRVARRPEPNAQVPKLPRSRPAARRQSRIEHEE